MSAPLHETPLVALEQNSPTSSYHTALASPGSTPPPSSTPLTQSPPESPAQLSPTTSHHESQTPSAETSAIKEKWSFRLNLLNTGFVIIFGCFGLFGIAWPAIFSWRQDAMTVWTTHRAFRDACLQDQVSVIKLGRRVDTSVAKAL